MAYVKRLKGCMIAVTEGKFYMIGDIKEPCAFEAYGLRTPAERNVLEQPYILLEALGPVNLEGPRLLTSVEGEALAQRLVDIFMIMRNGSISERLWRMILSYAKEVEPQAYDILWLTSMPAGIWDIVRDQVLRCS